MNEDKVIEKLFEHDQKFIQIGKELADFRAEYLRGQDQVMVILTRLDQERVFTNQAVRRLQDELERQARDVERQGKEIQQIKLQLQIA